MMKAPIAIIAIPLLMSGTAVAQYLDIPEAIPEAPPEAIEPSLESNKPGDNESPTAQGQLLVEPNFDLAPVQNEALGESNPLYHDDEKPVPGLVIKIPTD
jgi:hypothetical protein